METNPRIAWRIAYHQIYSSEELEKIRSFPSDYWRRGEIDREDVEAEIRKVSVQPYSQRENPACYEQLYSYVEAANDAIWKFELDGFHPAEPLQYLRYSSGDHYDWHIDHDSQSSTRKLTCILQLSNYEDYDGGDLQFFPEVSHVSTALLGQVGTLIIFPVYVPHRITEIISGQREALVGWIHGPPFR